ncbi:MAG: FkbM family methyltransferase [Planctomycetota bacterium]
MIAAEFAAGLWRGSDFCSKAGQPQVCDAMVVTQSKPAQANWCRRPIHKQSSFFHIRTLSMFAHHGLMQMSCDASAAFERGDNGSAEELCRRVLALDLEDAVALDVLCNVFTRTGRTAEALALQRAVLEHFRVKQMRNSMTFGLHLLYERGFRARGVFDVGAYNGDFSMLARQFWPESDVLMVEPQFKKRERLDELANELGGDVFVRSELLGEAVKPEVSFHQMATPWGSTGSSIYPEVSDLERSTVVMPMSTVDEVLTDYPDRCFDLMKLDVQGAELDVLHGASNSVANVEVLFAEVALHECNQGAPRLAEVVHELDQLGFGLFDLLTMDRDQQDLQVQIDAIFVRYGSPLWPAKQR